MKNNIHTHRESALVAINNMTENVNAKGKRVYFECEFDNEMIGVIVVRVSGKKLDFRTFLYRMKTNQQPEREE